MKVDRHYYTSQDELAEYPAILTSLKATPYKSHPSIIVLGESGNVKTSQKILILAAGVKGFGNPGLMPVIFDYKHIAEREGHSSTLAYCSESLLEIYANQANNRLANASEQDSQLIRAFYELLGEAMDRGASDVHIEVRRSEARVRYRIDGEMMTVKNWPNVFAFRFVQAVYSVVAEEQDVTFKPDQPQDAVIDKMVNDERLRVRLATIPAAPDGFDCIMRLLRLGKNEAQKALELNQLGYSDEHVRLITAGLTKPVGAIIIAGTTGSGKSTTLKNMLLNKIDKASGSIKVITVEDPPEYFIAGATQVPVSRNKKTSDGSSSFVAAVRAAMRSDPDILMVGEVRDEISASLLVSAVQSGHQAFSTVHAPSAISIIGRLAEMKVARDVLGSLDFIACLIYQALLPKLCLHCRQPVSSQNTDEELMQRIYAVTNMGDTLYTRGPGCEHCNNGIKGKTVVAEVILPDFTMLKYFAESRSIDALEHWLANGGKQIIHHGIEKMRHGVVSPTDVEDVLGSLTTHIIMNDGVLSADEVNILPSKMPTKIINIIENASSTFGLDVNDPIWNDLSEKVAKFIENELNAPRPQINDEDVFNNVLDDAPDYFNDNEVVIDSGDEFNLFDEI